LPSRQLRSSLARSSSVRKPVVMQSLLQFTSPLELPVYDWAAGGSLLAAGVLSRREWTMTRRQYQAVAWAFMLSLLVGRRRLRNAWRVVHATRGKRLAVGRRLPRDHRDNGGHRVWPGRLVASRKASIGSQLVNVLGVACTRARAFRLSYGDAGCDAPAVNNPRTIVPEHQVTAGSQ
jgi:hypothetical protein